MSRLRYQAVREMTMTLSYTLGWILIATGTSFIGIAHLLSFAYRGGMARQWRTRRYTLYMALVLLALGAYFLVSDVIFTVRGSAPETVSTPFPDIAIGIFVIGCFWLSFNLYRLIRRRQRSLSS